MADVENKLVREIRAKIYLNMILDPDNEFSIDDVPDRWKDAVLKLLREGEMNNG